MRSTLSTIAASLFTVLPFASAACAQVSPPAAAPAATVAFDDPRLQQILARAAALEPATLDEQVALCEIPAPPFKERQRAEDFARRMREIGLHDVRIDAEGNVIGERPGVGDGPTVLLSGHLDTVFPEGTDVSVTREGTVLKGPGIGDDCRGLAVVLAVARLLEEAEVRTSGTILFVGTVGEEGAGNLRGVRHLFGSELKDRVDYFLSLDGTGLDLTKDAVGSHRYEVTFVGPGGHSYGAFGMPNPIHALGRAIAKLSDFQVPADPKVTFSVGLIEGGTSVNSIAHEASMSVDMRSADPAALQRLDDRFQEALREAVAEEKARWSSSAPLEVRVDTIGIRPAAAQPADAEIVRTGLETARVLGFQPELHASSTDANLPMSLGVPAVTIDAGGSGQGAHSLDEAFDSADSHLGTQWALLYTLALSGLR